MKAKEFEDVCLYRLRQEEEFGRAMMVRYGVQGSYRKGEAIDLGSYRVRINSAIQNGRIDHSTIANALRDLVSDAKASADGWQPLQSLPDFTGVLASRGTAFDFDCKVCGDASLSLHDEKFKKRQLAYLLKRSKFGAITFVLIHFTGRQLKHSFVEPETWAFPVVAGHPFWEAVERGEIKSIGRDDCEEYAVAVSWNRLPGGRTERPDIVAALYELAAKNKALVEA